MALAIAQLFTTSSLVAGFEEQAADRASIGRTYGPFLKALEKSYGLVVPEATVSAVKYLNTVLFKQEKAPKLAQGVGAKAATVTVTQVLHAYALALQTGMAKPQAVLIAPLPAWADPVAIAAAKDAKKTKRIEKQNDDAAAAAVTAAALSAGAPLPAWAEKQNEEAAAAALSALSAGAPIATDAAPTLDTRAEALRLWALLMPHLDNADFTADERDSMAAYIASAPVRSAEPVEA